MPCLKPLAFFGAVWTITAYREETPSPDNGQLRSRPFDPDHRSWNGRSHTRPVAVCGKEPPNPRETNALRVRRRASRHRPRAPVSEVLSGSDGFPAIRHRSGVSGPVGRSFSQRSEVRSLRLTEIRLLRRDDGVYGRALCGLAYVWRKGILEWNR